MIDISTKWYSFKVIAIFLCVYNAKVSQDVHLVRYIYLCIVRRTNSKYY
jgi:hypothetical protein